MDEVAKKLSVESALVESWESGAGELTVSRLRRLAATYRRPLAVFYLPEPPRDFAPLKDYRRALLEEAGPSSALLLAERRAMARRDAAVSLYAPLEGEAPIFDLVATVDEDPEAVGYRLRDWLDVSLDQQRKWSGKRGAYNGWRAALERKGILVFQASGVSLREMRGFSLGELPLPAIVTNGRDAYAGRTFTLLHELAHLALRLTGVCDLREGVRRQPGAQQVEVFCNAVAAAVLMPRHMFLNEELLTRSNGRNDWPDELLSDIGSRYGASREAVLRRLLSFGLTTKAYYKARHEAWAKEYAKIRKKGGPVAPEVKAVASTGRLLARLMVDGFYQDLISASVVSESFGVKLSYLPRIERLLVQRGGAA